MKVGIDLGTSSSLISTVDQAGSVILLPDIQHQKAYHTPSTVCVGKERVFVGQVAEDLMEQDPSIKAIRFFKRNFGQDEPLHFDPLGREWYSESIASLVLKKLRVDAESHLTMPIEGAVVTVPAHFNDRQRKSVIAAAGLADIPILGIVEEPVAAALHYGVSNDIEDQIVMVYDLGGGTFDATILTMNSKRVEVLAKTGVTNLGGKEFDQKIATLILQQFQATTGSEPDLDARALLDLQHVAEDIKKELCQPNSMLVRRTVLLGIEAIDVEISRDMFISAVQEEINKTVDVLIQCVRDIHLELQDIDVLLMVGGGSLVPLVKEILETQYFGQKNQKVLYHDPMNAVAYGAALHCCQISGEADKYKLPAEFKGVSGYNVGIRTRNPQAGQTAIDTVVKKNMSLPLEVSKIYYATDPGQDRVVLDLVQFRDEQDTVPLGQLVISPIAINSPHYQIRVKVKYHSDGTIEVQAEDPQTGKQYLESFTRGEDRNIIRLAAYRDLIRSLPLNDE